MLAVRIGALLVVLGFPAIAAPLLVRAGRRVPKRSHRLCATITCLLPLAAPWLLACDAPPVVVWHITIAGGIVMLKAIDWLSHPRQSDDLVRVWLALTFWPALQIEDVAVPLAGLKNRCERSLKRFGAGLPAIVCGLALAALGQHLGIPARGVLLDSTWKTVEIYLLAGGCNHLMVGSFALAGFQLRDGFRYPFLAHSVLDFWGRYKVWIHRWLKQHIFQPIGLKRRTPVLGILAVFATSGLLHEYLFLPVDRSVLGWQLGYFLIHGMGAIAGAGIGRMFKRITGRRTPRALAIAATLVFIILSAPVFIHCLDRVIDLHRGLGAWVLRLIETTFPTWYESTG
jgi:Membrane bound O-acyl transferase family